MKDCTLKTDDGSILRAVYSVKPIDGVIASHTFAGSSVSVNTAYPAELQPRNRESVVLQTQVYKMARSLDPAMLTASVNLNMGAPVIRSDNVVLNGNGRAMAIALAYNQGFDAAMGYRQHLIDNAADFGLSAESVKTIEQPILVRVIVGELDSNMLDSAIHSTIGGSDMSGLETANADAARLKLADFSAYNDESEGNLTSRRNIGFVNKIIYRLAKDNERARYYLDDGSLSKDAVERVKRALFALAYNDDGLIERMTASTDEGARNISNALIAIAPNFAKLALQASQGICHHYNFASTLATAVKRYEFVRNSEYPSVDHYFRQGTMFDRESPAVEYIMRFFDANKRNHKWIKAFLLSVIAVIKQQGTPCELTLDGIPEHEPLSLDEVILKAIEYANEAKGGGINLLTAEATDDRVVAAEADANTLEQEFQQLTEDAVINTATTVDSVDNAVDSESIIDDYDDNSFDDDNADYRDRYYNAESYSDRKDALVDWIITETSSHYRDEAWGLIDAVENFYKTEFDLNDDIVDAIDIELAMDAIVGCTRYTMQDVIDEAYNKLNDNDDDTPVDAGDSAPIVDSTAPVDDAGIDAVFDLQGAASQMSDSELLDTLETAGATIAASDSEAYQPAVDARDAIISEITNNRLHLFNQGRERLVKSVMSIVETDAPPVFDTPIAPPHIADPTMALVLYKHPMGEVIVDAVEEAGVASDDAVIILPPRVNFYTDPSNLLAIEPAIKLFTPKASTVNEIDADISFVDAADSAAVAADNTLDNLTAYPPRASRRAAFEPIPFKRLKATGRVVGVKIIRPARVKTAYELLVKPDVDDAIDSFNRWADNFFDGIRQWAISAGSIDTLDAITRHNAAIDPDVLEFQATLAADAWAYDIAARSTVYPPRAARQAGSEPAIRKATGIGKRRVDTAIEPPTEPTPVKMIEMPPIEAMYCFTPDGWQVIPLTP